MVQPLNTPPAHSNTQKTTEHMLRATTHRGFVEHVFNDGVLLAHTNGDARQDDLQSERSAKQR